MERALGRHDGPGRVLRLFGKTPEPGRASAGPHRIAARKRIQREVGPEEAEHLHAELPERLDSPDLDDEIDARPATEITTDFCRDLGLTASYGTRPWKRRTPEDIVQLCTRAAQAGMHPPADPARGTALRPDTIALIRTANAAGADSGQDPKHTP